jgi:hypothetical protein
MMTDRQMSILEYAFTRARSDIDWEDHDRTAEHPTSDEVAEVATAVRAELGVAAGTEMTSEERRLQLTCAALNGILANPNWNSLALANSGVTEENSFRVAAVLAVVYAKQALVEFNKNPK